MRYVGYDQFRRAPAESRRARRANGVLMPALMSASVALLVLSRVEPGVFAALRVWVIEAATPVLRALMIPLEPVRAAGAAIGSMAGDARDRERLVIENERLKRWESRALDLERQLAELGAVAKTARDADMAFATARVMATSSGPIVRSAIINAGAGERLKPGYPVLAAAGLAGRVEVVGTGASRLLLLTDAESQVPVYVGPNAVRAVLVGDNGAAPRLAFPTPDRAINVGDDVSTSGLGGSFPRGLRVGTVTDAGATPRVAPHADLDRLEYVSILFYEPGAGDLPPLEARPQAGAGVRAP